MGYRFEDNPFDPEEHLNVYPVRANAQLNVTFGCYYMNAHDAKLHDHTGWPRPNYPDAICQIQSNGRLFWPYNNKTLKLDEIDLVDEGYDKVKITIDPTGLFVEQDYPIENCFHAQGWIDDDDHNLVRMKFWTDFIDVNYDVEKPIDVKFTLYVNKDTTGSDPMSSRTDAVEHGIIRILPASPVVLYSTNDTR